MKRFKNCRKGVTLIEAIIAIALVALMLTGLIGLQLRLIRATTVGHKRIEPLILLKNFFYETERKLRIEPAQKQFTQTNTQKNLELNITIEQPVKQEQLKDLTTLARVLLKANNTAQATKSRAESMLAFISLTEPVLGTPQ